MKVKPDLTYFKRLIDSDDAASVKRFLGIIWSLFLILAAVVILFVKVPIANQGLMHDILLYGFAIVFISILGVTIQEFALLGVKKAEALATAPAEVVVQNAQSVSSGTKVSTENVETINTEALSITPHKKEKTE